ncbi:MAG: hypothetical protein KAI79_14160 [Bacteroidales bacterium]|nr:hypothetical protein [Bacteroidales bacterium]
MTYIIYFKYTSYRTIGNIMQQISINGLKFNYTKERDLFNGLLKINGVSKKKFCEKFDLSYSYVNAWGSTTKAKEIKYPSWVFHYLKDVMYYKLEAIKIKIPLAKIYGRLNSGETLTDIYKEIAINSKTYADEMDIHIVIPEEFLTHGDSYVFTF